VFRHTHIKKSTLVQVMAHGLYVLCVTLTSDIVVNICGDRKDGGDIKVALMLVVFVYVKFDKYGRKKIHNSVRLFTFHLGAFTRILYCMTQLCFVIYVTGSTFRQSIFSFSSADI